MKKIQLNFSLNLIQTIITSLLFLFLSKFILKALGSQNLGLWFLLTSYTAIAHFFNFGFASSLSKYITEVKNDKNFNISELIQSVFYSIFFIAGFFIASSYPIIFYFIPRFIPPEFIDSAYKILPLMLLAIWINSISSCFQFSLDGLNLSYKKNTILIFSNTIYVLLNVKFIPRFGFQSLAYCQIAYFIILLVFNWISIKRALKMPFLPCYWSFKYLNLIAKYSIKNQISEGINLFNDFITKLLVSFFGGLELVAFYDLINQIFTKVKAVLLSSSKIYIPVLVEKGKKGNIPFYKIYNKLKSDNRNFAIVIHIALLFASFGISEYFFNRINLNFIGYFLILTCASFFSSFSIPVIVKNLASGNVTLNNQALLLNLFLIVSISFLLFYIVGTLSVFISILCASLIVNLFLNNSLKYLNKYR